VYTTKYSKEFSLFDPTSEMMVVFLIPEDTNEKVRIEYWEEGQHINNWLETLEDARKKWKVYKDDGWEKGVS
jgi:hypothetical protein